MHYKGYTKSRATVLKFYRHQLIDLIESLYGWDWGDDGLSEDQLDDISDAALLHEALRQHDFEWTIPTQQEHHYPDAED